MKIILLFVLTVPTSLFLKYVQELCTYWDVNSWLQRVQILLQLIQVLTKSLVKQSKQCLSFPLLLVLVVYPLPANGIIHTRNVPAHVPWHGFSAWQILDCHGGAWDLSEENSKISLNYKARMLDKQTFLRCYVSMEYGIFFRAIFKRFLLYHILILK